MRTPATSTLPNSEPDPRRWQALAVVCAAFFMTVLDGTIVTVASLECGLAGTIGVLIAARVVQGVGAAIVSPAVLSIIMTTFQEGSERNKALGIWGAIGGSGAAAGVLFGGVLTKYAGWEWIFFVTVPVGVLVLVLTRPIVRESRIPGLRGFDVGGAVTITSSLTLLVYAMSKAPDVGWATGRTIGLLIVSAALFVTFLVIETRSPSPMVSFDIFRIRTVTGANVCGFLLGAVVFANFFLLTLYVQQVLGYSALKTGLTFLATAGTAVATKATPATGCDNHAVFRLVEPDEWWSLPAGVFPLVGPKRDHRDCRDEAGDVRHAVRSRWPTRVCSNSP